MFWRKRYKNRGVLILIGLCVWGGVFPDVQRWRAIVSGKARSEEMPSCDELIEMISLKKMEVNQMEGKETEMIGTNVQEQPLIHATACEQILDWFDHYVRENNITIGDLLPSEDHIVHETKMSRTSVREALTRLRALGVIESRRKRGMRLMRSPELLELVTLLDHSTISPELVIQMGSFRGALEAGMEPEILRNALDSEIAELSRVYDQMVQNEEKLEVWYSLDLHFHELLITMSKNKVAVWMSQLMLPYYERLRSHVVPGTERTRENYRRIVQALVNRDPVMFHHVLHENLLETLGNTNEELKDIGNASYIKPSTSMDV